MKQNQNKSQLKIIKALRRVCGAYNQIIPKKSGNILNLLRSIEEEEAVSIADVSYLRKAKEKEIFPLALNFGHEFKNKNSFYRIELRDNILYFVGTESEILKKIREKIDELTQKENEE